MKIQILMSPGCGHGKRTMDLVMDVVRHHAPRAEVEPILVSTPEDAERFSFPGSPTIRVNGIDIDPHVPTGVGLA